MTRKLSGLAAALLIGASLIAAPTASAQVEIDITRGRTDPMPIAVPAYIAGVGTQDVAAEITEVIEADLERSGLFDPIDDGAFVERLTSINVAPRFADWRVIGARVLVVGEVVPATDAAGRAQDGVIQVNTRLYDVTGSRQIGSIAFKTPRSNARRAAHKVADFVYSQLTGEDGYFDTKVAFVAETGPKDDRTKRLMIMDQDGANVQTVTDGLNYDVLTPRYAPSNQQLIYLALFDNRPAQIYMLDIETGAQEALGTFDGMTFAPRFTPDGESVLFSVERGGNSDVAIMDLRSRRVRTLTDNPAIDVSPSMAPDGRQITFASDRGGSQQIYVMDADGTNQRRITFGDGTYGTPVWSPRGDLIAFTRQYKSRFYIGVVRPDGTGERLLTEAYLDESPAWSPNGRVIMFHREERPGGPVGLYSIDLTGQNLRRVPTPTEASDAAWSPPLD
jgi:TolB protein